MRKRSSKQKPPAGPIELVAQVVQTVIEVVANPEPLDSLPPAELVPEIPPGRLSKLTPARRHEIAKKAAQARWAKQHR